jgi:fluoroacetyl-CoA thioesterase
MAIEAGLTATVDVTVDEAKVVNFLGEDLRVYATPAVVADLEFACRNLLKEHLPPGRDSVGARVEITHSRPTPLGARVTHKISVRSVDGDQVTFDVEVSDALEVVATAVHVRAAVDQERLKRAVLRKREQLAAKG